MSFLQKLINSNVVSVITNGEDTRIDFNNGSKLNIFSRHSITPINSDLTGSILTSTAEDQDKLILKFNNSNILEISLKDEDYNGPEALSHTDPAGLITIWN